MGQVVVVEAVEAEVAEVAEVVVMEEEEEVEVEVVEAEALRHPRSARTLATPRDKAVRLRTFGRRLRRDPPNCAPPPLGSRRRPPSQSECLRRRGRSHPG